MSRGDYSLARPQEHVHQVKISLHCTEPLSCAPCSINFFFFLPGELPEGVLQELKAYSTSLIRGFLNAVTGSDMCSYFNTNFPVVAPLQSSLLNIMCSTTGHGWLLFNTHKQLSPKFHSLLPVTAIPICIALPAGRAPAPGELWGEGCMRAWLSGRKGTSRAHTVKGNETPGPWEAAIPAKCSTTNRRPCLPPFPSLREQRQYVCDHAQYAHGLRSLSTHTAILCSGQARESVDLSNVLNK